MSYRYLPWARRGLAAEVTTPDSLTGSIATRASFGVRLNLDTGATPGTTLKLYGPGDVIGIDPRVIVRTEPRRLTLNAEPDKFVAIEFDPPDFPWMFTPAQAGVEERLRPWCVLVVVAQGEGVRIDVPRNNPAPRLTIGAPAVPGDELPDLAESWAWAHTQVVETGSGGVLVDELANRPNLNVSRLMCPRRLEPGRDYYACLVPAFEAGRLAGLGQPVPDVATTGPAWASGDAAPASVVMPCYFHWEFRTGPAGDFESLARKLTPRPVPDGVGSRPLYLGAADPALPEIAPDQAGAILGLEGALRAPQTGAGPQLTDVPASLRTGLRQVLEAPANHLAAGTTPAEAVAPPLYGQWHARQHTVPASQPAWFRDLNLDPRGRATAGVGADVVRANQEDYMNAAWQQVGDVVAANRLLGLARLAREVAVRVHRKHVAPLAPAALLQVLAPVRSRIQVDERRTVRALVTSTILPDEVADAAFRRMTSPQSHTLRRAVRLARDVEEEPTDTGPSVPVRVVGRLAAGQVRLQPVQGRPDGLVTSRLLADVDLDGREDDDPVTLVPGLASVPARAVRGAISARDVVAETPRRPVAVRPDLATAGMVVDRHFRQFLTRLAELGGTLDAGSLTATAGFGLSMLDALDTLVAQSRLQRDAIAFVLRGTLDAFRIEPLRLQADTVVVRSDATEVPVARLDAGLARTIDRAELGQFVGRLPGGTLDPSGTGTVADIGLGPIGGDVVPAEPVVDAPPAATLEPLIRDAVIVGRFTGAFGTQLDAIRDLLPSIVPQPGPLALDALRATLRAATAPAAVITRRATTRIRIRGVFAAEADLGSDARIGPDLDPILAFPVLRRPLYEDLARYDKDRLLPGASKIPLDTVTLLETSPRFVESFLAGANQEMNRELLWREFPTDRRGTPMQRFWDRTDDAPDVLPIHRWRPERHLGENSLDDSRGALVLLVKGELLRRYPNSVIYAVPSLPNGRLDEDPDAVRLPVFAGQIEPDISFAGFDLTVEEVEPEPGWLFVIQEQPTEPRFGLDTPAPTGDPPLARWSDLTWDHAGVEPGRHLQITGSPLVGRNLPLAPGSTVRARFTTNSGHLAAITFQRRFRAAIHSRRLLEEEGT